MTEPTDPAVAAEVRVDVPATLARVDERWVLTLRRTLPHPPEAVWHYLTQPDRLERWSPVVPDRPLDSLGPATARENPTDAPEDATVLAVEAPRLLEHRWGGHTLRWTLSPAGAGTELVLEHTFDERVGAGDYAAGWRVCLARLAADDDAVDRERVTGPRAVDYGWRALRERYEEALRDT